MRKLSAASLLSVGLLSLIAACSDGDDPPDSVGTITYPVIGNAILGRGVVTLSKQSDHKQFCSAVLLNNYALLTSARCMQGFLPSQTSIEVVPSYPFEDRINAEMVSVRKGVATKLCVNSSAPDANGNCNGKYKQVHMYRENPVASGDSDNDLAVLYSDGYGFYNLRNDNSDYADIYMGDVPGGSNLEITGYGWSQNGPTTFLPYRASLPLMQVTSSSLLLWASPNARPCAGDQGSPYAVPGTGEIVGLHSYNEASGANGCASTGYIRGTRLRDKMGWIESIIGQCATDVNVNGQPIKRCYISAQPELECNGAPQNNPDTARWDGCRGSGCAVCAEKLSTTQYPRYFENHPLCQRNTTCDGEAYNCSVNCPKPTVIDQPQWGVGLKGTYRDYSATEAPEAGLVGAGYGRFDKTVNFNWGNGAPIASMPSDRFTVAWRGWLKVPTNGTYTFQTYTDDGVTLDVNGVRRISGWVSQAPTTRTSSSFTLSAGPVAIAMDYFDGTGGAIAQLRWKTPGSNSFVAIPAANLSPPGSDAHIQKGYKPQEYHNPNFEE
jgi:hypothetical protein